MKTRLQSARQRNSTIMKEASPFCSSQDSIATAEVKADALAVYSNEHSCASEGTIGHDDDELQQIEQAAAKHDAMLDAHSLLQLATDACELSTQAATRFLQLLTAAASQQEESRLRDAVGHVVARMTAREEARASRAAAAAAKKAERKATQPARRSSRLRKTCEHDDEGDFTDLPAKRKHVSDHGTAPSAQQSQPAAAVNAVNAVNAVGAAGHRASSPDSSQPDDSSSSRHVSISPEHEQPHAVADPGVQAQGCMQQQEQAARQRLKQHKQHKHMGQSTQQEQVHLMPRRKRMQRRTFTGGEPQRAFLA